MHQDHGIGRLCVSDFGEHCRCDGADRQKIVPGAVDIRDQCASPKNVNSLVHQGKHITVVNAKLERDKPHAALRIGHSGELGNVLQTVAALHASLRLHHHVRRGLERIIILRQIDASAQQRIDFT